MLLRVRSTMSDSSFAMPGISSTPVLGILYVLPLTAIAPNVVPLLFFTKRLPTLVTCARALMAVTVNPSPSETRATLAVLVT